MTDLHGVNVVRRIRDGGPMSVYQGLQSDEVRLHPPPSVELGPQLGPQADGGQAMVDTCLRHPGRDTHHPLPSATERADRRESISCVGGHGKPPSGGHPQVSTLLLGLSHR